jgi:hypothetical protein
MGLKFLGNRWPTEDFDEDLKRLVSLSSSELSKLAEWLKSLKNFEDVTDEDGERLRMIFPEREIQNKLANCVRITRFILRKWESSKSSLNEVMADLQMVGLKENKVTAIRRYLQSLERMKTKAYVDNLQEEYAQRGIPRITEVSAVCDIRGIFEEADRGTKQVKLIGHKPVVIMSLKSQLDDEPENMLTVQFTEAHFKEFLDGLRKIEAELRELGKKEAK